MNYRPKFGGLNGFGVLFYAVWLIVLVIIQPTVIQWISVFGISPDMFLIFVICAASEKGRESGAVCGFVFGLVFDMMIGRMPGVNAILYMYQKNKKLVPFFFFFFIHIVTETTLK